MARRRRSRRKSTGGGAGILVPLVGVLLLVGAVESDPRFFEGLLAWVLLGFGGWWLWRRYGRKARALKAAQEQAREDAEREHARQRLLVRTVGEMLALDPFEFEDATAELFRDLGYQEVRRVGGAGDNAADVVGVDPHGRTVVIQCKRYQPGNAVTSPEVQKIVGMAHHFHGAGRVIVVTTSTYTRKGWEIERGSNGFLELIDGERLAELLLQVRASPAPFPAPTAD